MTRVDWTDAELRAALLMRRRGDSLREIAGAGRAGAAGGERRRVP